MSDEMAGVEADIDFIIQQDPQQIVIRRGSEQLAAQTVRITGSGLGRGRRLESEAGRENRGATLLLGYKNTDIAVDDRFNDRNGNLMRVILVHADRRAMVQADIEQVQ